MTEEYTAKEIVKIAIDIEEMGKEFYITMAKKTNHEELRNVFYFLAQEEAGHKETFENLYETIDEIVMTETEWSDEYEAYFKAIASQFLFTPELIKRRSATGFSSTEEAVDFALQLEKDAVLTYGTLSNRVSEKAQNVITSIIAEEQKHIARLVALKQQI